MVRIIRCKYVGVPLFFFEKYQDNVQSASASAFLPSVPSLFINITQVNRSFDFKSSKVWDIKSVFW